MWKLDWPVGLLPGALVDDGAPFLVLVAEPGTDEWWKSAVVFACCGTPPRLDTQYGTLPLLLLRAMDERGLLGPPRPLNAIRRSLARLAL
jgi:hypothetical protein